MNVTLQIANGLPPGTSPYWKDHLKEWRILREYRNALAKQAADLRAGKDASQPKVVSVEVDPVEWCEKVLGIKADETEAKNLLLHYLDFVEVEKPKPEPQKQNSKVTSIDK